jgi:hypothetical protein
MFQAFKIWLLGPIVGTLLALSLVSCGGNSTTSTTRTFTGANQGYSTDDLYRFFAVAFGAAPGVTYMGQLIEAAEWGLSIREIVNIFTTKSQFTDTYPLSMSNVDFATKLVNNVVGASANDSAKQEAITDIVSALSLPNWTRGDVIYAVFNNLASKPESDTKWYGTAKKMANQVVYAKYYTETMKSDTTELAILKKVISFVDQDSVTTGILWNEINASINPLYQKNYILLQATSYLNMKNVELSRIKFPDSLRTITPDQPLAWAAGDFSKTGTLDIFTAKQNYSMDTNKYPTNSVVINDQYNDQYKSDFQFWRKDADGNLTLLLSYKGCLHPRKALVDDFNKDGFPDLYVACTGYDGLVNGKSLGEKSKLLINDGKGGFSVTDTYINGYYHGAASADVNGDGYPDIVVANMFNQQILGTEGKNVHVLINQKNGTFVSDNSRITGLTNWTGYWSVELIDVNNDGILDLIAGGDDKNNASAIILYGSANGTFGSTKEVIPPVAGRGTILDFTYVVNNGKRTLYIARTADNTDNQSWYGTNTLQAYDLTTKIASVVLDKINVIWEAWWLPITLNGQTGVTSYTDFRDNIFIYQ